MRPGEVWGRATEAAADLAVAGTDADLASAVAATPGVLVSFVPEASDVALGVGVRGRGQGVSWEVPMDALLVEQGGSAALAVNAVIVGESPDRLRPWTRAFDVTLGIDGRPWARSAVTTVVIATGQYLRGLDLVPRSHPGDGRAEVHSYRLRPGERTPMRRRLPQGRHVPHPRIHTATGRRIDVAVDRPVCLEVDGVRYSHTVANLRVEVLKHHYRLLV